MDYQKTIKRLAKQRGYTLMEFRRIAKIGRETRFTTLPTRCLPKILTGLQISQELFLLELLRDSDLPSDFKIKLENLKNKYLKKS